MACLIEAPLNGFANYEITFLNWPRVSASASFDTTRKTVRTSKWAIQRIQEGGDMNLLLKKEIRISTRNYGLYQGLQFSTTRGLCLLVALPMDLHSGSLTLISSVSIINHLFDPRIAQVGLVPDPVPLIPASRLSINPTSSLYLLTCQFVFNATILSC